MCSELEKFEPGLRVAEARVEDNWTHCKICSGCWSCKPREFGLGLRVAWNGFNRPDFYVPYSHEILPVQAER